MKSRQGYNPKFHGVKLSLPDVSAYRKEEITRPLSFQNFAVVQHKVRRFPLYTAVNIKGDQLVNIARAERDRWVFDSRISEEQQWGYEFYSHDANTFDIGHLVRRMDPCWGAKAKRAELDTFTFTNACPQHKGLNRLIWQELERHIWEKGADTGKVDLTVFTGPVLSDRDKVFYKEVQGVEIQIPVLFWKVIVWKKTDGRLNAVSFIQSQLPFVKNRLKERGLHVLRAPRFPDDYFENLEFKDKKTYQVNIDSIESQTSIHFKDVWTDVRFPYKSRAPMALESRVTEVPQALRKGTSAPGTRLQRAQTTITNLVM